MFVDTLFWHLLFAHLLSDYPLQSEWLIENKRSPWGIGLHVSIHFVAMFILVGPARDTIWLKLILLAGIHFILDFSKGLLTARWPTQATTQYAIDQVLHIISIFIISLWIGQSLDPNLMPINQVWPIYAIGYLTATYVWYITERILFTNDAAYLREVEAQFWSRMIARVAMLTGFLFIGRRIEMATMGMTLLLPYLLGKHRKRAFIIDLLVALIVAIVTLVAVR